MTPIIAFNAIDEDYYLRETWTKFKKKIEFIMIINILFV